MSSDNLFSQASMESAVAAEASAVEAVAQVQAPPHIPVNENKQEDGDGQPAAKKAKLNDGQAKVTASHNKHSDIPAADGGPAASVEEGDELEPMTLDEIDPNLIGCEPDKVTENAGIYFLKLTYDGQPMPPIQETIWTPKFDVCAPPKKNTKGDGFTVTGDGNLNIGVSVFGELGKKKQAIHDRILELYKANKFPPQTQFPIKVYDREKKVWNDFGFEGFVRKGAYKDKTLEEKAKAQKFDEIPGDAPQWENVSLGVPCHRDADKKVDRIMMMTYKDGDNKEITECRFTNHNNEPLDASHLTPSTPFDVIWRLRVFTMPARQKWAAKCKALCIRKQAPRKQTKLKFRNSR